MAFHRVLLAALLGVAGLSFASGTAPAQEWIYRTPGAPPPLQPEAEQAVDPAAVSGPTIYVVDKFQRLASINLGTKSVHVIGKTGPVLTDIAFNPVNHALYGITFTALYEINKATAATRFIGNLGVSDANALVFNSYGTALSAGVNSGELYHVSLATGRATVVGSTGGYASAGDLVFYNDQLVLAGFKGAGNIGTTTPNYLLALNEKTGAHQGTPVLLPIKEVFGLVSTGKNELYGLALDGSSAGLYQLFPTQASQSKRAVLLQNLTSKGLGQILGAAYDGNYQP